MTEPTTPPANAHTNVVPLQQQPEPAPHKKVANFVQDHPVMTIAGGLALGAIAAALIPRRNRKYIAKHTSMWAEAVTAASGAIAHQAIGQIEAAASGMRSQAHNLANRAEHAGHSTIDRMERVGNSSLEKARSLLGSRPDPTFADRVSARAEKVRKRLHR